MPKVKILPPTPLPDKVLSPQEFEDWQNELEIYLGGDEDMARFMTEGRYNTWEANDVYPHRLRQLHARDPDCLAADAPNRDDRVEELLTKRRRELKTFLGQVARAASKNMYATIVRHATSLQWIYNRIREDYDI